MPWFSLFLFQFNNYLFLIWINLGRKKIWQVFSFALDIFLGEQLWPYFLSSYLSGTYEHRALEDYFVVNYGIIVLTPRTLALPCPPSVLFSHITFFFCYCYNFCLTCLETMSIEHWWGYLVVSHGTIVFSGQVQCFVVLQVFWDVIYSTSELLIATLYIYDLCGVWTELEVVILSLWTQNKEIGK